MVIKTFIDSRTGKVLKTEKRKKFTFLDFSYSQNQTRTFKKEKYLIMSIETIEKNYEYFQNIQMMKFEKIKLNSGKV